MSPTCATKRADHLGPVAARHQRRTSLSRRARAFHHWQHWNCGGWCWPPARMATGSPRRDVLWWAVAVGFHRVRVTKLFRTWPRCCGADRRLSFGAVARGHGSRSAMGSTASHRCAAVGPAASVNRSGRLAVLFALTRSVECEDRNFLPGFHSGFHRHEPGPCRISVPPPVTLNTAADQIAVAAASSPKGSDCSQTAGSCDEPTGVRL